MNKAVDKKVVEMEFDNRKFEANAKTSISTLDKLKRSLNFDKVNKGLSGFKDSLSKVDTAPISKAVDTIGVSMSKMEMVGFSVVQRLTNIALDSINKVNRALVTQPITTGFNEYELKMGSLQTIIASTGESISTVNGYLNELNEYSDRTIYSFADMTQSIGKFTNAGVKLDDAVMAIKGISNEAAVSGANANEASRAMYNFAQALSAGYVKLIDWKSIENANMATVEFKQTLIDTAVELGTVIKVGDKYKTTTTDMQGRVSELFTSTMGFNEALSAQWMTTDVLVKTLGMYADETTDIGKKAYAAAQDVKTFTQLADTLKESAQSGWATTWELVVGDLNEAKELFTQINNFVSSILDRSADARNDIVRGAMATGYKQMQHEVAKLGISTKDFDDQLIKVARDSGVAVDEFLELDGSLEKALKRGWLTKDMLKDTLKHFTAVSDSVGSTTKSFEDLHGIAKRVINGDFGNGADRVRKLTDAGHDYAKVQNAVNILISGGTLEIEKMSDAQMKSLGYTEEEIDAIRKEIAAIEDGTSALNGIVDAMDQMSGREMIVESFKSIASALTPMAKAIGDAYREIFPRWTSDTVKKQIGRFYGWAKAMKLSEKQIQDLHDGMKGLFKIMHIAGSFMTGGFGLAIKILRYGLDLLNIDVLSLFGSFGRMVINTSKWITSNEQLQRILKSVKDSVKACIDVAKSWLDSFKELPAVTSIMDDFDFSVDGLLKKIADRFEKASEKIKGFAQNAEKLKKVDIHTISDMFKNIHDSMKKYFSKDAFAMPDAVTAMGHFGEKFQKGLVSPVKNATSTAKKTIFSFVDAVTDKLSNIDVGAIMAVGLGGALISTTRNIGRVMEAIAKPGELFTGILSNLKTASAYLCDMEKASARVKNSKAFINLAIGIGILAGAVVALTFAGQKGDLAGATLTVATLGILLASMTAVASACPANDATWKAFTAMALGIVAVSFALKQVAEVKWEQLGKALAVCAVVIGLLIGIVFLVNKFGGSSAAKMFSGIQFGKGGIKSKALNKIAGIGAMIGMSFSLLVLATALKVLSTVKIENAVSTLSVFSIVIIAMIGLSKVAEKFSKGASTSILSVTTSLFLLVVALKVIAKANTSELLTGLTKLTPVVIALGVLLAVTSLSGKNAAKAGIAAALMSASVYLIVGAITLIAGIDRGSISKAMNVVMQCFLLFGIVTYMSSAAGENATKAGRMILAMSASMMILSVSIGLLAAIKPDRLDAASAVITKLFLVMGIMIAVTGAIKPASFKSLIALTVAIGAISVALGVLANCNPANVEAAGEALSKIVLMMSLLVAVTSIAKTAIVPLLITTAVVVGIGVLIGELSKLPTADKIMPIAQGLGDMILSISVSCLLLSLVGATGLAALAGLGILALVFVEFGIVLGLIATFVDENQNKVESIRTAMELLKELGDTIGTFFGNIVGGFLAGVTSGLEQIGENLSSFAIAAEPFMSFVNGVNSETVANAKGMAEAIGILIDVHKSIKKSGAFNDNEKMRQFGSAMSQFGDMYTEFITKFSAAKTSDIRKASQVADAIGTLSESIPHTGNLFTLFSGKSDMVRFAEDLGAYGNAIAAFSAKVSAGTINIDNVKNATDAGGMIAQMANSIPNSGLSLASIFVGDNDISEFSKKLPLFGLNLSRFSSNASGVNTENVEKVKSATKPIIDIADSLHVSGGIVGAVFGSASLDKFGKQLVKYVNSLVSFSTVSLNVDPESCLRSVQVTRSLVDIANALPGREMMSGKNFASFGAQVVDYGSSLVTYTMTVAAVDYGAIGQSISVVRDFLDMFNSMSGIDFSSSESFAKALGNVSVIGVNVFTDAAQPVALKAGSSIATAIANGISDGAPVIASKVTSTMNNVMIAINARQNEIRESGQAVIRRMGEGMINAKSVVMSAISSVLSDALTTVSLRFTWFSNAGQLSIAKYATGITDNTYVATAAAIAMVNACAEVIRRKCSEFNTIGAMVPLGMANGINAHAHEVQIAAAAMADAAAQATRNKLSIHSPSRVFEQYGYYSDKGYANGITKNTDIVTAAMNDMVDSAMDELRMALSMSETMMDDMGSLNPVIRPVVDLDNVRASAQTISAMMSTTKARSVYASMQNATGMDASGGSRMGDTFTFTQINNSPKALSRLEIYRHTKNQIDTMKGLVKR